jgi:branched-chain amino acid transport system permease protein
MSRNSRIGLLIVIAVLAVLPFVLPNAYYLDVAIRMCINAIVVLSLNMLIGFAGQISLGHAGFLGIGAYASAVLPTHYGWPPIAALGAGAAVSGVLALLVARPIFALRGHYLAMATLGLGIILAMIFRNETAFTGGPDGIAVPTLGLFGYELTTEKQWYWLIAAMLVASIWATLNLVDSPFGRALRALHGSEVASQAVGVNIWHYKVAVFVLSALGASVMGSVTAHYVGFVTPNIADFFHSIELVTMVVVGGMASVFGSLVGAVLLTGLPQALAKFEGWETVIFGAILMLTMIFLPKGLVPTLAARLRRGD